MSITKVCNSVSQQDSLERTISRPLQQEINQIEADEIALETSLSISHPEVQPSKQKTPSLTSCASSEKSSIQTSLKLVQNCGPDCLMSQRIVDKLLSRMARLENERSELLAANRSWAVQYNLMKEKYSEQILRLKDEVHTMKKEKQEKNRESQETKEEKVTITSDVQNQINMLTHQAEVYKEDFLEERKARARAHSKLEELKAELKREKKSRARLMTMLQQQNQTSEKSTPLVG